MNLGRMLAYQSSGCLFARIVPATHNIGVDLELGPLIRTTFYSCRHKNISYPRLVASGERLGAAALS
jgi:hypothetical protein